MRCSQRRAGHPPARDLSSLYRVVLLEDSERKRKRSESVRRAIIVLILVIRFSVRPNSSSHPAHYIVISLQDLQMTPGYSYEDFAESWCARAVLSHRIVSQFAGAATLAQDCGCWIMAWQHASTSRSHPDSECIGAYPRVSHPCRNRPNALGHHMLADAVFGLFYTALSVENTEGAQRCLLQRLLHGLSPSQAPAGWAAAL